MLGRHWSRLYEIPIFLKLVQSGKNKKFIYRMLESEEVDAKKLSKKLTKKQLKEDFTKNTDHAPSSVQSSGYGSGGDSPVHYNSDENHSDHALTHAVKHQEHNYALLYALEYDHENLIQNNCIVYPELMEYNYLENDNLAVGCAVVEREDPLVEREDPLVEREDPLVEREDPLVEREDPLVEREDPLVEREDPLVEREDPIAEIEGLIAEIEGPLNSNMLPVSQMEMGNVCFDSESVNAFLADIVGCSNIWNLDESHNENRLNITNGLSAQNSCMQDLNQLFHIDNFPVPNSENYEEFLKNASELPDLGNYLAENEISTIIDPPSIKTQKVYECLHRQQIPGMLLLTFKSKLVEFCGYDSNAHETDSTRFIFDETTLQMISSCTLIEEKVLSEDHLLLIFKCIAS